MLAHSAPGVLQAILSAILLIGMLLLYLRRFAAPWRWVAVALAVCVLDQAAKFLLPLYLGLRQVSLLGGYLRLSYLQNPEQGFGGAFSYLLFVTAICVCALYLLYSKLAQTGYRMSALAEFGCALMIGGYLGILLDRIRLGFVIDFLEFGPAGAFVYNLADLAVFLALALLAARALQYAAEIKSRKLRLQDEVVL